MVTTYTSLSCHDNPEAGPVIIPTLQIREQAQREKVTCPGWHSWEREEKDAVCPVSMASRESPESVHFEESQLIHVGTAGTAQKAATGTPPNELHCVPGMA